MTKFKQGDRVVYTSVDNYFASRHPTYPFGWVGTVQRAKYPCRGRYLVLVDFDPGVSPDYPGGTTMALSESYLKVVG